MRLLILLSLLLVGCTTTRVEVQTPYMPTPPAEIMVPAKPLLTIPGDAGTDAKTALSIATKNNEIAKENATELTNLQQWIINTAKNITKGGK